MPPLPGLEGAHWNTQGGDEDHCLKQRAQEGELNRFITALDAPGVLPLSLYGRPTHTLEELTHAAREAGILKPGHGTVIPQIQNQITNFS